MKDNRSEGPRVFLLALALSASLSFLGGCGLGETPSIPETSPLSSSPVVRENPTPSPFPLEEIATPSPTLIPTLTPTETATPLPTLTATQTEITTPIPTETPSPTLEPTLEQSSPLLLQLDSGIISSLTELSQEIYGIKYLKSYKNRADELITEMGITDPYLVELYREFFNTEWVHPSWPEVESHGLGIYILTEQGEEPDLHSAVGLLYGFVPIENIPQQVIEAEKNASNTLPRPYYLILQIEPGKNLTPENNPDAFVALKMGAHIYGGEYNASGFALKKAEDSKLEGLAVVERITSQEPRKTNRGPDVWTLEELSSAFGLRKNSLIFVTGMALTPGEASVSWFSIIVPEFPSEEVQKQYYFFLTD